MRRACDRRPGSLWLGTEGAQRPRITIIMKQELLKGSMGEECRGPTGIWGHQNVMT